MVIGLGKCIDHFKNALVLMLSLALTACVVTDYEDPLKKNKDPEKSFQIRLQLAKEYMKQGDSQRANLNLTKAKAIKPNDPELLMTYALFFDNEGDDKMADKYFNSAMRQAPTNIEMKYTYANFLLINRDYDKAIKYFELVVKDYSFTERAFAFEGLGIAYYRTEQSEKARQAFERATRLNDKLKIANILLVELLFDEQQYNKSRALLDLYEKNHRDSSKQLWLGIKLARVFEDDEKVRTYSTKLKKTFPGSREYELYKISIGESN